MRKAAGISQPYVVRMFGSKENLFVEVLGRGLEKLTTAFEAAIAESKAAGETVDARSGRIAAVYADLITDRGILLFAHAGVHHGPRSGDRREGQRRIPQNLLTAAR